MMLLGLSFLLSGSVLVICGILREFSAEQDSDLPEIEPISKLP